MNESPPSCVPPEHGCVAPEEDLPRNEGRHELAPRESDEKRLEERLKLYESFDRDVHQGGMG